MTLQGTLKCYIQHGDVVARPLLSLPHSSLELSGSPIGSSAQILRYLSDILMFLSGPVWLFLFLTSLFFLSNVNRSAKSSVFHFICSAFQPLCNGCAKKEKKKNLKYIINLLVITVNLLNGQKEWRCVVAPEKELVCSFGFLVSGDGWGKAAVVPTSVFPEFSHLLTSLWTKESSERTVCLSFPPDRGLGEEVLRFLLLLDS